MSSRTSSPSSRAQSSSNSRRPNWEPKGARSGSRNGAGRGYRAGHGSHHTERPGMEGLAEIREGRRKPRHKKHQTQDDARRTPRGRNERNNSWSNGDDRRRDDRRGSESRGRQDWHHRDDSRRDDRRSEGRRWNNDRQDRRHNTDRRDDRSDFRRSGQDRNRSQDRRWNDDRQDRRQGRKFNDRGWDGQRRDDRKSDFKRNDDRRDDRQGYRGAKRSNRRDDRRDDNRSSRRNDGARSYEPRRAPKSQHGSTRNAGGRGASATAATVTAAKSYVAPTEFAPSTPVEAATGINAPASTSFVELGVDGNAINALATMGITSPMPIQSAVIPDALGGRDILGRGRTGSGKTVAFAAPIVTRLTTLDPSRARGRAPRALVLAPTRELVAQINKTLEPLAKAAGMFTLALVGGVPQRRQVLALQKGVDILVATPGRLEDLANQGRLSLDNIRIITVDEADEMCDMGFIEPLDRIFGSLRANAQHMLFSATLDHDVQRLVDKYFTDPVLHDTGDEAQAESDITHLVFVTDRNDKVDVVAALAEEAGRSIIFTRTRAYSQMLADDLDDYGVSAVAMHGDLKQHQRQRNLKRLESGDATTLVATDVAARGIHIDALPLVIQADMAEDPKAYIHRSGRTGRAGATGVVVSIVPPRGQRKAERILDAAEITAPMIKVTARDAAATLRDFMQA